MIVPTESRATIAAYRVGRTEKQFIADMWDRRRTEHPGKKKATGKWPAGKWSAWRASLKAKPSKLILVQKAAR